MKKSGLADSPFFPRPSSEPDVRPPSQPVVDQPVYPQPAEPMNGRTNEHLNVRAVEPMNTRTDERMNVRADERLNSRTDAQANVRTDERPSRPISRQSYNIYDDQAEAIDGLALRWRKERGRHITKGEVMRELLDQALQMHG